MKYWIYIVVLSSVLTGSGWADDPTQEDYELARQIEKSAVCKPEWHGMKCEYKIPGVHFAIDLNGDSLVVYEVGLKFTVEGNNRTNCVFVWTNKEEGGTDAMASIDKKKFIVYAGSSDLC